jgi:hypothetical protein
MGSSERYTPNPTGVPCSSEKAHPLAPPQGPRHGPTVGSWSKAFSCERGTPVKSQPQTTLAPTRRPLALLVSPDTRPSMARRSRGGIGFSACFRVLGSEFGILGLELNSLVCSVECLVFRVQGLGYGIRGLRFGIWGLELNSLVMSVECFVVRV